MLERGWCEGVQLRVLDEGGSGLERFRAEFDRYIRMRGQVVIPIGIGWCAPIPGENVDATAFGQIRQRADTRFAAFCSRRRPLARNSSMIWRFQLFKSFISVMKILLLSLSFLLVVIHQGVSVANGQYVNPNIEREESAYLCGPLDAQKSFSRPTVHSKELSDSSRSMLGFTPVQPLLIQAIQYLTCL